MASTLTTFDALLKERYYDTKKIVEDLVYPENWFLGMLKKNGDAGMQGDNLPIPIVYGLPQNIGGTFSVAAGQTTNKVASKFSATAGDYFGVVELGDKVLKASRTNAGAFLENKQYEIDGLYEQVGENLNIYAWGNGGGALGRRASISSDTITLNEPADASNFEIGLSVVASANDGSDSSHALRTNSATVLVTAVDVEAGTVTVDDESNIGSFANGDYLFRQSDFFGDTGNIVIKGIQAYITATNAPGALWGVTAATRALHPSRWAGCRVPAADLAGKSIEGRIKLLLSRMSGRFKSKRCDAFALNPEDFDKLDTMLASHGQRDLERTTTKFGYESIAIHGPMGKVPIYSDRHCPIGHGFAMRMKNIWISSMDDLIHVQNSDGFTMLRRDASTNYQYRLLSYPILALNAPINFGRVALY